METETETEISEAVQNRIKKNQAKQVNSAIIHLPVEPEPEPIKGLNPAR